MESYSNFHDYGPFSDDNQAQKGSAYNGLNGGGVAEGRNSEDLRYYEGLDVSHFQPAPVFESENSSAQSSFMTDFTSSQPSSYTVFSYAGNDHFDATSVPHEATESHNWLPTFDASTVYTNFRQDINNSDKIAKSPRATAFMPLYNVQSPQITSPLSITYQQPCSERTEPLVYAPQDDFEQQQDGESGENLLHNNFLGENPTQQPNRTGPSRFRSLTKPKLRASNFYCSIRPCNHQRAFARKADLERHLATQHSQLYSSKTKLSQCPWSNCERQGANGFPRRDKMLQHQDRVHGRRL